MTSVGSLREMSAAGTNSRSGILPPGSIANKPSGSALPSRSRNTTQTPETRKTVSGAATTRLANGTNRTHGRTNSYASSTRTASIASRNGPYSVTGGPGSRPASSMGFSRPYSTASTVNGRRNPAPTTPRAASALGSHDEEPNGSIRGQRKGTPQFQFSCFHGSPLAGSLLGDSITTSLNPLPNNLEHKPQSAQNGFDPLASKFPVPSTPRTPSKLIRSVSPSKKKPPPLPYLSKDSKIRSFNYSAGAAWDYETRENSAEEFFTKLTSMINQTGQNSFGLKEALELYKQRVGELEKSRDDLTASNTSLRVEIETIKFQLAAAENALKDAKRDHEIAMDDFDRQKRVEVETVRQEGKKELDTVNARHEDEIRQLKWQFERELEDEKALRHREINQLTSKTALDTQQAQIELDKKGREISALHGDLQTLREHLEREQKNNHGLRQNLDTASNNSVTLESSIRALKARIEFLESGREEQSQSFERLNQQMMDALAETNETKDKLRREETLRRKLHNQVQELKGNIRVFCRVRPSLNNEDPSEMAHIQYPDESEESKEINLLGPEEKSSLGTISRKNNNFAFDRVFGPSAQNAEVFEEISQLVQSALDGYNVCIFCYGQTGSGKTYTMSSLDGMIPRAVHQIYDTARDLEEKGWRYTMEGNFVEVYNENLNDLLGKAEELDKKKHEIRHDMQRCKTMITDVNTVRLESPEMVESILKRAAANRSVAATKANERSSRSHSVFILKLTGENSITGERSEGTLNLVDLAGSERLSQSGATGERLKETQNINRSLSSLGDVIAALGQGKEGVHIPYRNSKLTYLLQFSLGGNSKTLMFVMASPLQAHMSETLTSLKFATKVHNTHIGTAKRQARVRD
ncbi:kinesin-like protein [Aspergillus sclerotialis]|uniref:Kinesin-like protein n=1 Tax=Aspergillus sclerotialis TaxID=2070753 RepID=A0A3A2ZVK8_9EURO|nr:kinesin-like protein [Aspergillus sclerotialis]